MPTLTMAQDQVLNLKVQRIHPRVKEVTLQKQGKVWRHDIYLVDKHGNEVKGEYLIPEGNPDKFVEGLYQNVKCLYPDPKGPRIEPYDGELPSQQTPHHRQALPRAASEEIKPPALQQGNNCHNVNLSGKSITFATAYAKDILVAEMRNWKLGRRVSLKDIKRMMGWTDLICVEIADRINL